MQGTLEVVKSVALGVEAVLHLVGGGRFVGYGEGRSPTEGKTVGWCDGSGDRIVAPSAIAFLEGVLDDKDSECWTSTNFCIIWKGYI
jgi:hypothetical protein